MWLASMTPSAIGIKRSPASANASRRVSTATLARRIASVSSSRRSGSDAPIALTCAPAARSSPAEDRDRRGRAGADEIGGRNVRGHARPRREPERARRRHQRLRMRGGPRDHDDLRDGADRTHRLEVGRRLDAGAEQHESRRVGSCQERGRDAADRPGSDRGELGAVDHRLRALRLDVEQHIGRLDERQPFLRVELREGDQLHANARVAGGGHRQERAGRGRQRGAHRRCERRVLAGEGRPERVDRHVHRQRAAQRRGVDDPHHIRPIAARKPAASSSSPPRSSSSSLDINAEPTIAPSANAHAAAALAGVAIPTPTSSGQIGVRPHRLDHLARRLGERLASAGDTVGRDAVDEPSRGRPDRRVPLGRRPGRRQQHDVDLARIGERLELGRLVDG